MKSKLKELTRKDIDKIPPAPIGQRFCDFPEKDREFSELLLRFIKLRDGAARELIGDDEGKPDFLRRALEVLHVTGLNLMESNCLTYVDEIKILRAAAKMKRQQKAELQEVLKKAIAELASKQKKDEKQTDPTDLISTCVALNKFCVSRSTLKRNIGSKLKSYRQPNAPKNRTHLFSEAEIEKHWPRRKSYSS